MAMLARLQRSACSSCREAWAHRGARGPGKSRYAPEPLDKRLADAALPFGNYPEGLGAARLLSDDRGAVDLGEDVTDLEARLGELGAALPARPAVAQLHNLDSRKHLSQPHAVPLCASAVVCATKSRAARAVARHREHATHSSAAHSAGLGIARRAAPAVLAEPSAFLLVHGP